MLILVNGNANAGRGAARWERVGRELRARGVRFEARATSSADEAASMLDGHDVVVAAGGDGTVNGVLNAMIARGSTAALGAIGLGSSNDFHKPFGETIAGVPVRIDSGRARPVDVGRATIVDTLGRTRTRWFCLNASVGLVAEGNAFFNTADPALVWLKRRSVDAAILYAALVNLVRFRPVRAAVRLDHAPARLRPFASLGILKKVHFAGGMRYDTPVQPDDGLFDVNLWGRTERASLVRTLANLLQGRFLGLPGARTWRARHVRIEPERPVHLELDGEVMKIACAELEVVPKALRVCG